MNLDEILVRSEVLKQLTFSAIELFFLSSALGFVFYLSTVSVDWLKDGTFWNRCRAVVGAFRKDWEGSGLEYKAQVLEKMRPLMLVALAFVLGYLLGGRVQSEYVSGNITLLITVARVTNYYKLAMVVLTGLVLSLQMLLKVFIVRVEVKGFLIVHNLLGILGYVICVGLGLASLVLCYINLV